MEEEEIEVPVVKEPAKDATKMDTDETPDAAAPPATGETDANMQDDKGDIPGAENGVPESGDKPVQMETDAKVSSHLAHDVVAYLLSVSSYGILNVILGINLYPCGK